MLTTALAALLLSMPAASPHPKGTQLIYRGTVASQQPDRSFAAPEKNFDLTLIVAASGDDGTRLYWLVDERGRGGWKWSERFGSVSASAAGHASGESLPSLLYEYGETESIISLVLPLLPPGEPLTTGHSWENEQLRYELLEPKKVDGRSLARVQVSNSYGPKRTLFVEPESRTVRIAEERVFMGMGHEHQVRMVLQEQSVLEDEAFSAAAAGFDALIALREKLGRKPRATDRNFDEKQREALIEGLPEVAQLNRSGPLAKLVRGAQKDVEVQSGRATAVAALETEFKGKELPSFNLSSTGKETLTAEAAQGQVTVFHFWEYREPLEEPYGQIGFLEFSCGRWKDLPVKVVGVAVDGRFDDESQRSSAIRGVKKVKQFMNLSYPVFLDGGKLVKQLGDPRTQGAELPLWIVVGPDGKIAHYHVGNYEVDRNEGLKLLDQEVRAAAKGVRK